MKRYLILLIVPLLLWQCQKEHSGTFVHPSVELHGHITFSDGTPAEGIVVSDGYNCTTTDAEGYYCIEKRWTQARFVSYTIPADVEVNIGDNGRPEFYKLLDYDVQEYDFTLKRQEKEKTFRILCLGDPQVCAANKGLERFNAETAPDIRSFVSEHQDMKTYSISMGDHVHNEWASFGKMFDLLNINSLSIPNFAVVGNHDHQSAADDYSATAAYVKVAGPTNYSFDRGDFHIIVADDIHMVSKKYTESFSQDVLDWMKNDLRYVSRDKSLILATHAGMSYDSYPDMYNLLAEFKEARWVAGHNHDVENKVFRVGDKDVYLHVVGTTNGVDWVGTICGDGAPMGYAVLEMDGTHVNNSYYKPTKLPAEFQIRMYRSPNFPAFSHYTGSATDTYFDWYRNSTATIINVWGYTPETWKVTVYEDGVKVAEPILDNSQYDMWACTYFYAEKNRATTSYCKRKNHLFHYTPVNPSAQLKVVVEDEYGHVYEQTEYTDSTHSAGSYD